MKFMKTHLEKSREILDKLKRQRKSVIRPQSNFLVYKPAFELEYCTECLLYRTVELADATIILLEAGNYLGAIITARCVQETIAALWYLNETCSEAISAKKLKRFYNDLHRLMMGWKDAEPLPKPINVMDMIRMVGKDLPDFEKLYNQLSEFAHPNWCGTQSLFAKIGDDELKVELGRYMRSQDLFTRISDDLILSLEFVDFIGRKGKKLKQRLIELCRDLHSNGELSGAIGYKEDNSELL
jgi:hypothetical protein